MVVPVPLRQPVGRGEIADALVQRIRAGRGAVLVGPAGVGKTTLADHVVGELDDDRWYIAPLRGSAGGRPLTLEPLLALVGSLADAPERVTGPLFAEVRAGLRRLANGRRVVFFVDDIGRLDGASLVVIHHAVVADGAVLLATLRRGTPMPPECADLVGRGLVDQIGLDALEREDADRLADQLAGVELARATKDELWQRCQGNALFVREVLRAAREAGRLDATAGAPVLISPLPLDSPNLVTLVEDRLRELAPAERTALVHLAFAEPCGPAEVASVADADLLVELERRELVRATRDGRRLLVSLAHPLYSEVLRASTGTIAARQVFATLAGDLLQTSARRRADVVKLGRYAVDGDVPLAPELLLHAQSVSYLSGDIELSERIGRLAFERRPSIQSGWDLAHSLGGLGDLAAARASLDAWRDLIDRPSARLAFGFATAQIEFWLAGDPRRAEEAFATALAMVPVDDDGPPTVPDLTRSELNAERALVLAAQSRPADALVLAEPLLASDHAPTQLRAALAAAHAHRIAGRPGSALNALRAGDAAVGRLGEQGVSLSPRVLERERALALGVAGDLAAARAAAERVAADTLHPGHRALGLAALAEIELAAGRPHRARAAIERAIDLAGDVDRVHVPRRWLLGVAAHARARADDRAGAHEALRREAQAQHPATSHDALAAMARAELGEHPVEAVAILRVERERLAAAGLAGHELHVRRQLAFLGDVGAAMTGLDELAASLEGARYEVVSRHIRAVTTSDAAALGALAEAYAEHGFDHDARTTARQAARLERDPQRRRDWEAWAAALDDQDDQPREPTSGAAAVLTAREREVAELAAGGASSRTIGERLFISVRTVDNHLARAYTKLGISRRADLGAALRGAGPVSRTARPRR